MSKLAEMRAKLQNQQNSGNNQQQSYTARKLFPHWNDDLIPVDGQGRIRFLPDGDTNNTFFWKEKLEINLQFPGIKGGEMREVTVKVPCMETWGEVCPILSEVRPWWKGAPEDQELARKYWKKYSYILQGFVCELAEEEPESPENPIRLFKVNRKIFDTIKSALMDDEFDESPDDYEGGTDFIIKKTKSGQFKSYDSSMWARRSRSLTAEELGAIEQYGLYNLTDEIGIKPNDEQLKAISEMFEASLNGDLYDPEQFAWLPWRPYGVEQTSRTSNPGAAVQRVVKEDTPKAAPEQPAATSNDSAPESTDSADSGSDDEPSDNVQDILARIRQNQGS